MQENFDEWLAIHQIFPTNIFHFDVPSMEPTINLSNLVCPSFVNASFVVFYLVNFLLYGSLQLRMLHIVTVCHSVGRYAVVTV